MAHRLTQKEFSNRLREVIRSKDEAHDVLAARCGLSKPSFESYLYHQNLPGARALAKLCYGLDISADWLLFGGTTEAGPKNTQCPADIDLTLEIINRAKRDRAFENAVIVSAAHLLANCALNCNVTDAEKATKWFQETVATNILANLNVAGSA